MSLLPPYAGSASIPSSTFWRNIEKKSTLANAVEPASGIDGLPGPQVGHRLRLLVGGQARIACSRTSLRTYWSNPGKNARYTSAGVIGTCQPWPLSAGVKNGPLR